MPAAPASATSTSTPTALPKPITTRLLALHTGQLVLVGPCLRVQSTYGPDSYLLVWPADFEWSINGATVVVSDLLEKKQTTWHLGDIIEVGGGEIPRLDSSLRPVPPNCPGPYWVVSGWGTDFTPTPGAMRTPAPPFTSAPALTATPTAPSPAGSVVAAEPVTLRAGPGTEYDPVGQLIVGQPYPVVGRLGQWWQLQLPDRRTAWVVNLLVTFTGNAKRVPVLAAPPTPTRLPDVTEAAQGEVVTFTSTAFGITFSYKPAQLGVNVRTRVAADRVYVFDTDNFSDLGQYVQVLHKAPADSLQQAIRQQILRGYSPNDCHLVMTEGHIYEGVVAPAGYVFASIRLPPSPTATWAPSSVDTWATEAAQSQRCPQPYTEWGGQSYFIEDTRHPDRFFFFKIGQYWIYSAGPSEYGDPWQSTLRVLDVSP